MNADRLEAAKSLAESHSRIDPDVKQVYLLESAEDDHTELDEPIKLLEIVEGSLEVGVEPIGFAADLDHGRRFRTLIVEISPREFASMGNTIRFKDRVWRITQALLPSTVEA